VVLLRNSIPQNHNLKTAAELGVSWSRKMHEHTREGIIKAGFNPEIIEAIGVSLASAKNIHKAMEIYNSFEREAEKLPWPQDRDFGALVLQSLSKVVSNTEIKHFMLSKAISRAHWCATCSTSGGEGLARAEHIHELKAELLKCN
jgi:hypothetical protein